MLQTENRLIEELFRRHHATLVAFLTRLTRCPQHAEDLAQTAWLKLLIACGRGSCSGLQEAELRAYLFTVARNTFLDECTRKHEAVRTSAVDPMLIDGLLGHCDSAEPGPDDIVETQQVSSLIRAAVVDLPAPQRRVISLWARGVSIRDMATACSAPTDTVLSRRKYALARLRSRLAGTAVMMR